MNEKVQVFLFGSFELNINDQTIHLPTLKVEVLPRFRQIGNYIAIGRRIYRVSPKRAIKSMNGKIFSSICFSINRFARI